MQTVIQTLPIVVVVALLIALGVLLARKFKQYEHGMPPNPQPDAGSPAQMTWTSANPGTSFDAGAHGAHGSHHVSCDTGSVSHTSVDCGGHH